ncbi:DUF2388 domain-containing protein [Pseudomonas sp. CFBP 13715]|uniref:DUF2388 domain-containing protein n=2 Tax=Pseudomonas TaxID=286 RepID=UPI00387E3112
MVDLIGSFIMGVKIFALAALLVFPVGIVSADGLLRNVLTSGGTLASSYLTSSDYKRVIGVRDDASSFVASQGKIRGAYLEAMFQNVRGENPGLRATDMELAQAILERSSRL